MWVPIVLRWLWTNTHECDCKAFLTLCHRPRSCSFERPSRNQLVRPGIWFGWTDIQQKNRQAVADIRSSNTVIYLRFAAGDIILAVVAKLLVAKWFCSALKSMTTFVMATHYLSTTNKVITTMMITTAPLIHLHSDFVRYKFALHYITLHYNGDQAARRPHILCSICGCWFTTCLFGVRGDRDELIR